MASKETRKQATAKKSTRGSPHRTSTHGSAAQRVREAEGVAVDLPVVGKVQIPPAEELAYYVGLAVLAASEIIEWPVALIVAASHALTYSHHNRVAQELGEAVDESRAAQEVGEALEESDVAEEVVGALAH
jgi:hypothetical protein